MIPILFPETEAVFADANGHPVNHGLGDLVDVVSGHIAAERNGGYTLEMQYPMNGRHYDDLATYRFIWAQPSPTKAAQPFEIREITRPLDGIVTVRAVHLSHRLTGIVCTPCSAIGPTAALQALKTHSTPEHAFTFETDISTPETATNAFTVSVPTSVRALMGGVDGSILDTFSGEWEFDIWKCRLLAHAGADRGVQIRYGKNMTDLSAVENVDGLYTGVYPYWKTDEDYLELSTPIVPVEGSFPSGFSRILTLDLSAEFDEKPTEEQLQSAAVAYINSNALGTPRMSINVSFAHLARSEDYKSIKMLERVELCDTVHVFHSALGVSYKAKVVKTDYDFVNERYNSITVGTARHTLAETVSSQAQAVEKLQTTVTNPYRLAMNEAANSIQNADGGYMRLHDKNGDGKWDELLAMDTEDIASAQNIWRFNQNGLGHSSGGYNAAEADWNIALLSDGRINADRILTGHMHAQYLDVGDDTTRDMSDYFRVFTDSDSKVTTEIGARDSAIRLQEKNDRVRFVDTQGNELAYFAPNSFNITDLQAFILQGLKIAVLDNGAYGFMANDD